MLVGIPGSGKSTWARDFVFTHPGYCIVSTDVVRAELYGDETVQGDWQQIWRTVLAQWHQGIAAIQRGELDGVIYDATNARRRNRREAIAAARQIGFTSVTLIWFDVPLNLALERNRGRWRQVPTDIVVTMHRQLQGAPPSMAEGVEQVLILPPNSYPKSLFSSSDPLR
ncbi:AAA family ATPase [filamentous cyanobacterium CCP3]|nr:AAA family ATPase [filamentous cyanobacterium CCP3]